MSTHHATMPPSSLPALAECPCYESGEAGEAAHRGTMQHAYLEQLLSGDPKRDKCLGLELDEREAVEWAYDHIQEDCQGQPLELEQRVPVMDEDFREITFGRLDVWCKGTVTLYDYKSGEIRNYYEQMTAYGLGVMQREGLDRINVQILYGRHRDVERFTLGLEEAERVISAISKRVNDPDKKPQSCDYCGWCKHRLTCSEVVKIVESVSKGREDWEPVTYHASDIDDPIEMAKILDLAKKMKDWAESVEFHAKEMVKKDGRIIPGWELVTRQGNRYFTSIEGVFGLVGLPQDKFLAICSLSPSKLEELFAEFNGMSKSAAGKELAGRLKEFVARAKSYDFLQRERKSKKKSAKKTTKKEG